MALTTVDSIDAFYPSFPLNGEPMAIPCTIRTVVDDFGGKHLQTPFAMLPANGYDITRAISYPAYFADEASCMDYLAAEYPHRELAAPLMAALCRARRLGFAHESRFVDKIGVSIDAVYRAARGHRSLTVKQIRKLLAQV